MSGKSDKVVSGQPDSVARQTLVDLIEERGLSLADDPRRCEGLLHDLCGSCRREINILMAAVHERVAVDLVGANDQLPREVTVGRLVKRLVHNRGLTREVAVWAVESWALACGVMTPEELTPPPPPTPVKPPRIPPRRKPAPAQAPVPVPVPAAKQERKRKRKRKPPKSAATPAPKKKKKLGWAWVGSILVVCFIGLKIVQFAGSMLHKEKPLGEGMSEHSNFTGDPQPMEILSPQERKKNAAVIEKFVTRKLWGSVFRNYDETQITRIDLEQRDTTDEDFTEIFAKANGGLRELEVLVLGKTQITDASLVHLQGLTSLRQLSLDGTAISDAGLVYLQGLTSLTDLDLRETQITDAGLVHLYRLTSLKKLNCSKTEVTMRGVEQFKQKLPLCNIKTKFRAPDSIR